MNILKAFIAVLALVFVMGCAMLPPAPPKSPTIVKVPVATPMPPPPAFVPTPLPIDDLKPSDASNYSKIATAYANSIAILKKELATLSAQLDAYRLKTPVKAPQATTKAVPTAAPAATTKG